MMSITGCHFLFAASGAPCMHRPQDTSDSWHYSRATCWKPGSAFLLNKAPVQVTSFRELLALRIGFAAAQSTQNPICFSLIPELFPKQRTFAMAAYNSAIYMGRALSFAAVIIAGQLGATHSTSENIGVQLVRSSSLLSTSCSVAALLLGRLLVQLYSVRLLLVDALQASGG